MIRRFVVVLAVALVLQGTVFAVYYDDLLFLRRSLPEIAAEPRERFVDHAVTTLGRSRVTVAHLDTIAGGAQAFDLHDLEVTALERRLIATPEDRSARLRLADALRRAGRFPAAEAIYLDILTSSGREQP